jgi:lipopolysaccharide export system protein LptA
MKPTVNLMIAVFCVFSAIWPEASPAQGTSVGFGASAHQNDSPLEITSDRLVVDQATGRASLEGSVLVIQGELRLSANRVLIEYQDTQNGIEKLHASGNVVLVNGKDAAEASSAMYQIGTGEIVMTGDVLMTQGRTILSAQRMVINLQNNTAQLEGRVKTVLKPAADN